MEESSEAHREADVSSTTEDVPEVQEVTGSNGMETVLIVEKLEEDTVTTNFISNQAPFPSDENASTSKPQTPPKEKTTFILKSPNKESEAIVKISPSKIVLNNKETVKIVPHSISDNLVHSSVKIQQPPVHASSKPTNTINNVDVDCVEIVAQKTPTKISPSKQVILEKDTQKVILEKDTQKTPPKEVIKVTPSKEAIKIIPSKDVIIITPSKEAIKLSPSKESIKLTPSKEAVKLTPTKEQLVEITKQQTPTKDHIDEQKIPEKTPRKEPFRVKIIRKPYNVIKEPPDVQKTKMPIKVLLDIKKSSESSPTNTTGTEGPAQSSPVKDNSVKQVTVQKVVTKNNEDSKSTEESTKNVTPKETSVNGNIGDDETKQPQPSQVVSTPVETDKEVSNDSQEADVTEKEHNKSISRELRSLINSAKESKIISECTQLTSKTRKSRTNLDSSNPNNSIEAGKPRSRRNSDNSQKSNCSGKSDKATVKRSMRSQNPEFVNKVKLFLNSVTKTHKDSDEYTDDEVEPEVKPKEQNEVRPSTPKKKKVPDVAPVPVQGDDKSNKLRADLYCWRCHWLVEQTATEKTPPLQCTVCPRSFHYKCLSGPERNKVNMAKNWVCPECMGVLHAESSETRSPAMKKITLGMLCDLLKHALERMMDLNGVEPFMQPVDRTAFPDYDKYVVHPMDLSLMKDNIAAGVYGSTEAFLADAQWIQHNSIIFNTLQSKLTAAARALVRSCRAEMGEIEACPECYAAAHARRATWFTDVCTAPHVLLWAKLKGFPYWPAKGMSVSSAGLVDVRFFGAHDRAWVPAKDCFLFSEKDPNNFRTKRQDILDSMQEAEQHIRNISRKYGKFVYPPFKTQFDPTKLNEQIKMMIPTFEGEVRAQVKEKPTMTSPNVNNKRRSNSKSSKGSANDGDTSEGEEASNVKARKMADGAEIARVEDDSIIEKDKSMEVEIPVEAKKESDNKEKDSEPSRKRRRSELEEAVITIVETSGCSQDKKRKVDGEKKAKPDTQEPTSSKDVEMKDITPEKTNTTEPDKTAETPENSTKMPNELAATLILTHKEKTKELRIVPIRIVTTPKGNKQVIHTSTPKEKDASSKVEKKPAVNKSISNEKDVSKEEKSKHKRRNSRKHSNNKNKLDDNGEKKDKANSSTAKESNASEKAKEDESKKTDKAAKQNGANAKGSKEPTLDDDMSLAVFARKSSKDDDNSLTGLPTISNVRTLATVGKNTPPKPSNKTIEVTIEPNSDCSIFTPTSTDNVKNMKEAVTKLQKLRSDTTEKSMVGRVGVRAFARMTSPTQEINKSQDKDVEVEIKAEPIEFDDSDRQMEKMDLMNAFQLRPVNPMTANLRDVRINKVVAPVNAKKPKTPEIRPRAKKTFPQPRKPDEGRSELNGKNSMVYIPIQPPTTPLPIRQIRPSMPGPRFSAPINTSLVNTVVNTSSPPTVSLASASAPCPLPCLAPGSALAPGPALAPVGQAPPTVHTVPLITSVNGQWTFSLQPIKSVGGLDRTSSPPTVNGLPDRNLGLTGVNSPSSLPALMPGNRLDTDLNLISPPHLPMPTPMTTPMAPMVAVPFVTPSITALTNSPASPMIVPTTINRVNENTGPGEPPRLQQRPLLNPLDSLTPVAPMPAPSSAGRLTAKINQNAVKMTDFFRTLLEDAIEKLDDPQSQLTAIKLQLEHMRWRHQQEVDEIKHNHELTMAEMRASFEKEKKRLVSEARRAAQIESEAAVKAAKSKQWCANCTREAQFYCCWNTSYCDYPCQRAHWTHHFSVCTQQRNPDGSDSDPPESRLQPQPDNLPALQKSTPAPTLTVGGKVARVYSQDSAPKSSSIIMSVVEDTSGNQTLKCVGTYKQPASAPANAQISPVVVNKPVVGTDDAAKKVVTSGGYLIVGTAGTSGTLVTPSRRTHSIQYYT